MSSDQHLSRNLFSCEILGHALSGASGSIAALAMLYPLDTVRSLLQVDERRRPKNTPTMIVEIAREEGVGRLYRGLVPVLTSLCASNFVYFYTFHGLREFAGSRGKAHNAGRDLLLAAAAGIVNVLVTTPLWVVNTRLKFQGAKLKLARNKPKDLLEYKGIADGLVKIARHEGVRGLWGGTGPSLLLVLNPAIQFMMYEALKRYFKYLLQAEDLSGTLYFIIGAVAKAAATFPTYPLQIIQNRLRFSWKSKSSNSRIGIVEMLRQMIRLHGFRGLFVGIEAKLLQTILTSALMFLFYEKIALFVFHLMKLDVKHIKSVT